MTEWLFAILRRLKVHEHVPLDLALTDVLTHPLWTQRLLEHFTLLCGLMRLYNVSVCFGTR
jgi:hypothetical protein